jgi:hypothetical protein
MYVYIYIHLYIYIYISSRRSTLGVGGKVILEVSWQKFSKVSTLVHVENTKVSTLHLQEFSKVRTDVHLQCPGRHSKKKSQYPSTFTVWSNYRDDF